MNKKQVGEGRRVLIAGAGIGGLTTAIALKQLGFAVDVLEAAPALKPVGAGILLAPNALQVFAQLGIVEKIKEVGYTIKCGFQITDRHRRLIQDMEHIDEKELFGHYSTTIHRVALQQVLLDALGEAHVHTGKRCQSVEQDDNGVTLTCEDGSQWKGDCLLGADGIHSAVRQHLFPDVPMRYSGETCWRGLSDFSAGTRWEGCGFEMWGHGIRLGLVPISESKAYWFATEPIAAGGKDPAPEALKELLLKRYADFADPALPILKATHPDNIMRHDLYDFAPLPHWVKGRIALLGDAAHATTPNLGQGGGQAIEDAWGLQLCLQREETLPAALQAFETLRKPKAQKVVKTSYMLGKMAQIRNPLLCWLRNAMLRLTPSSVITKQVTDLYQIPRQLPAIKG